MTFHQHNLKSEWFNKIVDGTKTCEGRLYRGNFRRLIVGDIITWKSGGREVNTRVVALRRYNNFFNMLINEGIIHTLPGKKNMREALNIYHNIYEEHDIKQYGVLAIILEKITE